MIIKNFSKIKIDRLFCTYILKVLVSLLVKGRHLSTRIYQSVFLDATIVKIYF